MYGLFSIRLDKAAFTKGRSKSISAREIDLVVSFGSIDVIHSNSRPQHEGEWHNNQLHGRCRHTEPDGAFKDRVWVAGVETDQTCDMGFFFSQLKCRLCAAVYSVDVDVCSIH